MFVLYSLCAQPVETGQKVMALLGVTFFFSCIVVRALQSRIYLGCGTVVTASLDICSVADTFTSRLLGA